MEYPTLGINDGKDSLDAFFRAKFSHVGRPATDAGRADSQTKIAWPKELRANGLETGSNL